jgi:hypothetical protein
MEGWIKLHRSCLDHWLYTEYRPLTRREAWETILFTVNYEPKKVIIKGQLYDCDRGQSILSLQSWAEKFVWSIQQVRTFFKLLENDNMIIVEGLQYSTRLTVCNYAIYQDLQQAANKPLTDGQQAANKPLTTTKEREERKKESNIVDIEKIKKDFYQSLTPFVKEFGRDTLREFYEYWSEPNKSKTKIKFQLEKTWDTRLRLLRWVKNDFGKNKIEQATTKSSDLTKLYKKID